MHMRQGAEEGTLWTRKPLQKNQCGRGFLRLRGAPASALSHRRAIWLADVAQSQHLVILGNEQGQARAQGLLQ